MALFKSFDHVTFWVGNAKQASSYYCARLGFRCILYKGLETGSRQVVSYVVRQNKITLVFQGMLEAKKPADMCEFLATHGDGVKDVAFEVEDIDAVVKMVRSRGGQIIKDIWEESDDDNDDGGGGGGGGEGMVRMAVVQTFGDVTHTLVDRSQYRGHFLPNYVTVGAGSDSLSASMPPTGLLSIDHIVGNQPDLQMDNVVDWYERVLSFNKFWSIDERLVTTQYSSLRSTVLTNVQEDIKMTINEPAPCKGKSQIQEFIDYNGGPGIQHMALLTDNIVDTVENLKTRGLKFITVPGRYYVTVRENLKHDKMELDEDLEDIERLGIMVDYDKDGYLLQTFTQPMQDRPTLFLEVIQRHNHQGFGAGNYKSLFEVIEMEQDRRGNLMPC